MLRVDSTVDEGDNDSVPVQPFGSAQPDVGLKQAEEARAEIGCQRPDLVFPDMQDLRHVLEPVRLRGGHLGRKPVEAVAVAVDLLRVGRSEREQCFLLGAQPRGVTLDCRTGFVEPYTRQFLHGHRRAGLAQRRVILGSRRRAQLDDVYLPFFGVPDLRELQASGDAGVAQRRVVVRMGADGAERQAETGKKNDWFHGSSGGRQPASPCQCQ